MFKSDRKAKTFRYPLYILYINMYYKTDTVRKSEFEQEAYLYTSYVRTEIRTFTLLYHNIRHG